MAKQTLHAFKVLDIEKKEVDLAKFAGKLVLVVNVASKCGFTPQVSLQQYLTIFSMQDCKSCTKSIKTKDLPSLVSLASKSFSKMIAKL